MSKRFKIIFSLIIAILLVLSIGVGSWGYISYINSSKENADIKLEKFTLTPSKDIMLGTVVSANLKVSCPWGHFPDNAEVKTTEGTQIVSEPVISKLEDEWGKAVWNINLKLQPYRTGAIKKQECIVTFISGEQNEKTKKLTTDIPAFSVLAIDTAKKRELDLASKAEHSPIEKANTWYIIAIAVVALVIIIACVIILRRKRKEEAAIVIPPWVLAIDELHSLREKMKSEKINKKQCVNRLTDIVRGYIEERFEIPATAQTTHEFLSDLEKASSPLAYEYRAFIREFLSSADLIKFAKLPASLSLVEDAMDKAENLVDSTTPTKEEQENMEEK